MIEFVRFYAHYRKKKRVFLRVLQSINNIFNYNCGSSPFPPPSAPSSEFSGSFRPCSLIISSYRVAFIVAISGFILFQRSKRSSRNFPLCKQVVNRKISEFIARKLDFFTFNIPLTTETALRSFENQIMIIKRNGKQTVLQTSALKKRSIYFRTA